MDIISNGEIVVFYDRSRPDAEIKYALLDDDDQAVYGTPFISGEVSSSSDALALVAGWLETSYG